MITVLTGNPGSGKTLYAIAKLLQPLIGTHVEATDDDGNKVKHERVVFTNINGLTLPHEKIDAAWLADWPKRVKPGAVICYDEVQKPWPKRVTGSKVPPAVAELETHRHYGVDFVVLTQKPELMDQNVGSLAGRHLHLRRVGNSHNTIVYEWDAVSRGLLYKNSFKKSGWRYPRKVFDWYKSAEAHTKMPRSVPFVLWVSIFALAGAAYAWPTLISRITEGIDPEAKRQKAAVSALAQKQPSTPSLIISDAPEPATGLGGAVPLMSQAASAPSIMGCVASAAACRCYDQAGLVLDLEPQICEAKVASPAPAKSARDLAAALPGVVELPGPDAPARGSADGQVIADMRRSPAF